MIVYTKSLTLPSRITNSILYLPSSILYPLSSILYPLSSILYPLSSILYPLSSILYPPPLTGQYLIQLIPRQLHVIARRANVTYREPQRQLPGKLRVREVHSTSAIHFVH
jgi:hypothetical protein